MFGTEWGNHQKSTNKYDYSFIKTVSSLVWNEHCVECAAPLCYSTCLKYRKRKDGRCRLFNEGICKISKTGLLGYSAKIQFEGWSKLESVLRTNQLKIPKIRFVYSFSSLIIWFTKIISKAVYRNNKPWKLYSYSWELRERLANMINKHSCIKPDAFYMNFDNHGEETTLTLEIRNNRLGTIYMNNIIAKKGNNEKIIDYNELMIKADGQSYISLKPDKECELTFNALDFVTFSKEYKKDAQPKIKNTDHKIIKCVAWDLDNTIWDGILIEGKVSIKPKIIKIMRELDEKGIINSVVSKNNKEEALKKIEEFSLLDLIVFPQINWNPKSINILSLAKKMNIGTDSICFIDDSVFELSEVSNSLPEVLCLNVESIDQIKDMDCFNTKITEDSKKRRLTYKMMEKEQNELESWDGNIDDFLKTCCIKVNIAKPKDNEIYRCYELIQRTNQLNASGRRLSLEEINYYINSDDFAAYTIKVKDKFGDYGIVGFSIFSIKDKTVTDFVISCRVANKTIEQAFIQFLFNKYCSSKSELKMQYKKTTKNGPLFKTIKEMNMVLVEETETKETYSYNGRYKDRGIVTIA